jgi:membrane protein required for colicin V production
MTFDLIILILACLAFYRGWKKGLLWALGSLVAVLLAVIISMKLSHELATYLFNNEWYKSQYTVFISFLILFFATIFGCHMLVKFVEKILDKVFLGWVNNLSGAVLYSFFVVFVISTFCWLANQVGLLKDKVKQSSKSYAYIEPIAPVTLETVTNYLPYCENLINQIKHHVNKASTKIGL